MNVAQPKRRRRRYNAGWDFIAPALLIITIFVLVPCVWGIALSFTRFDAIQPVEYIGTANYQRMWTDPLVRTTLVNTVLYVALTLPTGLFLALLVALALNEPWFAGRSWARGVYFLPNVTSMAAVAFVWEWLLNPEYGLINAGLLRLQAQKLWGVHLWNLRIWPDIDVQIRPFLDVSFQWAHLPVGAPGWLSDPDMAMASVAMVGIWHSLGFTVLIFLAGLKSISADVYEAARIDGASALQQFRFVTWPLLTPTTMFLTIMGVIGGFQVFQSIYIMTGGGPLDRTRVYLFYLWQSAFQQLEMGYASAMAVVLFIIVMALTLLQWRFFQRRLSTWQ